MNFLHPRIAVVFHDLFMTWLAWMLSYVVRYSIWQEAPEISWIGFEIGLVIAIQGIVAYFFNRTFSKHMATWF